MIDYITGSSWNFESKILESLSFFFDGLLVGDFLIGLLSSLELKDKLSKSINGCWLLGFLGDIG